MVFACTSDVELWLFEGYVVRAALELQERSEIVYVAGYFSGQGTISEIVRM